MYVALHHSKFHYALLVSYYVYSCPAYVTSVYKLFSFGHFPNFRGYFGFFLIPFEIEGKGFPNLAQKRLKWHAGIVVTVLGF